MNNLQCRSCGNPQLLQVLSLGKTPLANSLLTPSQLDTPERTFPLELVFCPCCALVQITETVPPHELFSNYLYFSSFADTTLTEARKLAECLIEMRALSASSLVVEIASNDGYLLTNYLAAGIPILGIEPAKNIAQVAQQQGVDTIAEFFGVELAHDLRQKGKSADIIHGNNVLAHVADLNGVVEGIGVLLKPEGLAVIEVPYVKDMIEFVEFDTIYHEHLCYFSLSSLHTLFSRHGLDIVDVERIPIHGGSLRVYAQKQSGTIRDPNGEARVTALLGEEQAWGVSSAEFYQDFGIRVEKMRQTLLGLLSQIRSEGKRIVAYGASAKGSTLLNYFGIDGEIVDYVVDRSKIKKGYYTPGTHLEILSPDFLLTDKPDYVLLLTWNFANEILEQQEAYRSQGGKFIIPVPDVRVV